MLARFIKRTRHASWPISFSCRCITWVTYQDSERHPNSVSIPIVRICFCSFCHICIVHFLDPVGSTKANAQDEECLSDCYLDTMDSDSFGDMKMYAHINEHHFNPFAFSVNFLVFSRNLPLVSKTSNSRRYIYIAISNARNEHNGPTYP